MKQSGNTLQPGHFVGRNPTWNGPGPSNAIRVNRLATDRQGHGSAYVNIKGLLHELVVLK